MVSSRSRGRSLRRGLGLAISSIGILAAPSARADCVQSGNTTTCSATGTNPWTSTVGTGRNDDGKTVTVESGATIDTNGSSAISLGDNANVNVSGTVQTSSDSGMGNYGTGNNTIEANSNSTIIIAPTGKVIANGTNQFDEPINVHGYGNRIVNYGLIQGGAMTAVWFQDEETGTRNILDNYGTITRPGGTGDLIGSNAAGGLVFYNRTGARVEGDLRFPGGDDDVYFEPNSVVTGIVDGGEGTNNLFLQGPAGTAGTLTGTITNFSSLIKQGEGGWTVGRSLEGFPTVDVRQGTLTLTGNNVDYSGTLTVDPDGTLAGRAQSMPVSSVAANNVNNILNNGLVRFTQTDDGTYAGQIVGTGGVEKTGAGVLVTTAANSYSGGTRVAEGELRAGAVGTFSPASVYTTDSGALLNLDGYAQTVGGLVNGGEVQWGQGAPGNTLVAGSYVGQGGVLTMKTRLGDDTSPADQLHVTGDTAGSSYVRVVNLGGTGAQTNQGIRLIDVDGASNGDFTLLGDYNAKTGRPAIVAGAYAYSLVKGSPTAADDGDWYLRSTSTGSGTDGGSSHDTPLYQPGVPLYEVYGQALLELNKMPTLQQRVGNRYWVNSTPAATPATANGAPAQSTDGSIPLIEGYGVWARVEGGHGRLDPRSSDSDSDYTYDVWRFQGGLDTQLWQGSAGKLIGGVNVHYGTLTADVRSFNGDGKIDVEGYGFGGTLTWYGDNGFYVDGQGQVTRYDSNLHSDTLGQTVVKGNDGFGYGLSLETGKRIRLNEAWTLTPQVQLPFSTVDFDSFTDPFGARVERRQASSLNSRAGVSADYESAWKQPDGQTGKVHVYGITNVYYEMLDGVKVDVSSTDFSNDNERLWGGVGLGGSVSWADGRYSLYAEAGVDTPLSDFGDSYGMNGTLGLRYKW